MQASDRHTTFDRMTIVTAIRHSYSTPADIRPVFLAGKWLDSTARHLLVRSLHAEDTMKKSVKKKIALHRETIRSLARLGLARVNGGIRPGPPTYANACTFAGGGICTGPSGPDTTTLSEPNYDCIDV